LQRNFRLTFHGAQLASFPHLISVKIKRNQEASLIP
jgi:hypothetical protein